MPMLPRRRDDIREPVEKLNRREFDDAIGPRPGGLASAAGPDPVRGFVPGQHVADAGDLAVWGADHGEPFERKGGTCAISEEMFETPRIAGHVAVDERDPNARVHRKSAVLPGEHVGGRVRGEQTRVFEPADHAAAHPLDDRAFPAAFHEVSRVRGYAPPSDTPRRPFPNALMSLGRKPGKG